MWSYEYINKNFLEDCVMQTLIIYFDDSIRTEEFVKMSSDDPDKWSEFADNYILFLQSLG